MHLKIKTKRNQNLKSVFLVKLIHEKIDEAMFCNYYCLNKDVTSALNSFWLNKFVKQYQNLY
jgi:hypothetical protein